MNIISFGRRFRGPLTYTSHQVLYILNRVYFHVLGSIISPCICSAHPQPTILLSKIRAEGSFQWPTLQFSAERSYIVLLKVSKREDTYLRATNECPQSKEETSNWPHSFIELLLKGAGVLRSRVAATDRARKSIAGGCGRSEN